VNAGDETDGTERRDFSPGDIDTPRIFLYDAYPGGIGFSAPLFGMHEELLARTRTLIEGCECEHGCPTCVGPVGETGPLAKGVALRLLPHLVPMASPRVAGAEAPALQTGAPALLTAAPALQTGVPALATKAQAPADDVPF
jgi:ATP-dependent helicase YprA (DUF1998 family)